MRVSKPTARLSGLLSILLMSIHCAAAIALQPVAAGNKEVHVIPKPRRVQHADSFLSLNSGAKLHVDADQPELSRIARMFADATGEISAFKWDIQSGPPAEDEQPFLWLTMKDANAECGSEGYEIEIGPRSVTVRAPHAQGVFYGVQTVRQMLHAASSASEESGVVELPCVKIFDKPRFEWRGMHLDVCRHFMPAEFVKRYIDLLALHKFNTFHWHLTEDQGWRIEIKAYPRLHEIAAWRDQDGQRYGGYYTQDQVREIVRYAADRYITVVPEIEMPGHTLAALAAYPNLSCTGGPFEVANTWGIYDDVYCAGNEETFTFLQNVIDEVLKLFPASFVHIGGDECPKKRWAKCPKCQARIKSENLADEDELQSYLIKRMVRFIQDKGRRAVGWDEILEGGLAEGAVVMSWRGVKGGIAAARAGHDVIMCPTSHCYFDYRQRDAEGERGPSWAPVLDLKKVYSFDPIPSELSSQEARHVLGVQGNVWTERIPGPKEVEYMAFPRACALAEVGWSAADQRDWTDFSDRLRTHAELLTDMKVTLGPMGD